MTTSGHILAAVLFTALILPASAHEAGGDLSQLPDATLLPKDVVQVSGVVPGMGEHWANPADLPLGPIYGVSQGKVIFFEFMIDRDSLAAGTSYLELASKAGFPLPSVDHVDFDWQSGGHEGYEVPHYDVHFYFVPHAAHMAIAP